MIRLMKILVFLLLSANLMALAEIDKKMEFEGKASGLLNFSTKIPLEVKNPEILTNPNQPERNIKIEQEKTLPWTKLFSALIAISILIWMKSIPKSKEQKETLVKSAKALANLRLKMIEPKKFENKEVFYAELSDILRAYIEDRYQIKALKQTTEEFLATIEQNPAQFPEVELSSFMSLSDKVKFAKVAPSINQCALAYETVKKIIDN